MPEATQLIKVTTIKNITLMKKILVIINKNWETEPVLNALTNPKLRPAALPFPEVINTPCDGDNRMSQPRAVFSLPREGEEPLQVVVRCIEDLMATGVNTSSSLEKYKVLPQAIAADAADLIISSMEKSIKSKKVTYDFARLMDGATEVSCSAFGDAMIARM